MSRFINYSLSFLLLLIAASSCKKEDIKVEDELPPITQEGLNTFGCKIDGEVLVRKDGKSTSLFVGGTKVGLKAGNPQFPYDKDNTFAYINVGNYKDANGGFIYLHFPNLDSIGKYSVGQSTGGTDFKNNLPYHSFVLINQNSDSHAKMYLTYENSGEVHITKYDFSEGIISGTFKFDMVKESDPLSDTISVTEGRFDINWRTLNQE